MQILAYDKQEQFAFTYPATMTSIPSNAVVCKDADIPEGMCFFGKSVYSDSICDEMIGKINAADGLIYMAVKGRVERCPFFQFLTEA